MTKAAADFGLPQPSNYLERIIRRENVVTLDKRDADGNLIKVEDNAVCILKIKHGVVGTLTVSQTDYGEEDNSTVIFGTKGLMRIRKFAELVKVK